MMQLLIVVPCYNDSEIEFFFSLFVLSSMRQALNIAMSANEENIFGA